MVKKAFDLEDSISLNLDKISTIEELETYKKALDDEDSNSLIVDIDKISTIKELETYINKFIDILEESLKDV